MVAASRRSSLIEKSGRLLGSRYDGSVRGEITSSPWEDNARATRRKSDFRRGEHAPMQIHRSECRVVKRKDTLEGRVMRRPNAVWQVQPPSKRTRCGYTLRQSSWQKSVGFILTCIACEAGLSLKEARAHPGRCGRAERWRKGERVDTPLQTSREVRFSLGDQRIRDDGTRSRSSTVFASQG